MKPLHVLAFVIAGLHLSASAVADESWYVGTSLGSAEATEIVFDDFDDGSAFTGSTRNDDFGWKIFGGFTYNRFFAIEAAYVDLGDVAISATSDGNGVAYAPGPVTASIATTGFSLSVIGTMPVSEKFALHARAGFFAWEAESELNNSAFAPTSGSFDGSDPTFGIGATYEINDRFAIRGEYEKYTDIDTVDGSLASLGVTISF